VTLGPVTKRVHPHVTTVLLLDGHSWNILLGYFTQICRRS